MNAIMLNKSEKEIITNFFDLVFRLISQTKCPSERIFRYLLKHTEIEINPDTDKSFTCKLNIDEISAGEI